VSLTRTHVSGGLLDVVTRRDLPSPSVTVYDSGLSDHKLLQWSVPVLRPVVAITTVARRPWHHLDVNALSAAIRNSQLCRLDCRSFCSFDDLASMSDSELTSICDAFCPGVDCHRGSTVTVGRLSPWVDCHRGSIRSVASRNVKSVGSMA